MEQIDKVLYTGRTTTTGGRSGSARSDDGRLDLALSPPGSAGAGKNPKQLFAAGWSACFIGAMGRVASEMGVKLPAETAVDAEVDLGMGPGGPRYTRPVMGTDPEPAKGSGSVPG